MTTSHLEVPGGNLLVADDGSGRVPAAIREAVRAMDTPLYAAGRIEEVAPVGRGVPVGCESGWFQPSGTTFPGSYVPGAPSSSSGTLPDP